MKNTIQNPIRLLVKKPSRALLTWAIFRLLVAAPLVWPARGNDFRLGPLIGLSDPDIFAGCGSNGAEKESSVGANPTNPKNIFVAWIGGLFKSIGSAVSFDG